MSPVLLANLVALTCRVALCQNVVLRPLLFLVYIVLTLYIFRNKIIFNQVSTKQIDTAAICDLLCALGLMGTWRQWGTRCTEGER